MYSVGLPGDEPEARRTLWLFGDSFVTDAPMRTVDDRVGSAFVHNSIAISRCAGNVFEIDYYWGHDDTGRPAAFFDTGRKEPYWWLFGGFVHRGALYVGLLEVEHAEPRGALRAPFALVGMQLARIDDPTAHPSTWRPRVLRLSTSRDAFPGSAMTVYGDHVLLFGFLSREEGRQPRFLARLPLSALANETDDLSPALETLTRDGHWTPGLLPDRALVLMPDNATEMSVRIHPELAPEARWLAVYGAPIQTGGDGEGRPDPSGAIYVRTAPGPEGPWSARRLVYAIPEVGRDGRGPDPRTFCYAAKEHLPFARPGELLITYVCNLRADPDQPPLQALHRLAREMSVYLPRVVRVPLPEAVPRDAPAADDDDPHGAARDPAREPVGARAAPY